MCHILVQADCSQELVGSVIEEVLESAGINVVGPTMSERKVAWTLVERGVMADIDCP